MTFRSGWNILVCGIGLILLFVGYSGVTEGLWSESPLTVAMFLAIGLWVSVRAALCMAWVDSSGVKYLGIIAWKKIPWAAIEDVTCELRGGSIITSAVPVVRLKGGQSVSLDGLAGYTARRDQNARVTAQVQAINDARKQHHSDGMRGR
ncbi:hypothetical protein ACFY0G_01150 [Streptomyces sp. NPDC001552]|uniref:hypothetical protein n=1 Tax=Streptomyces sp. NPDC001552 TaxID=3364587 RepID=UPI0036AE5705